MLEKERKNNENNLEIEKFHLGYLEINDNQNLIEEYEKISR